MSERRVVKLAAVGLGGMLAMAGMVALPANSAPASVGDYALTQTIPIPGSAYPNYMAITPNGSKVYVSAMAGAGNTVWVLNTASSALSMVTDNGVPALGGARGLAATPDGTKVYVAGIFSNSVSVINTASDNISATVALTPGSGPLDIALTPDGTKAYVTRHFDNKASVIRTSDDTQVAEMNVGGAPRGVATNGAYAYVADGGSNSVSVINTATNAVSTLSPVATFPYAIATSPDGTRVYATLQSSDEVKVIDTATNSVVGTPIAVGDQPSGLAVSPDGDQVYVTNFTGDSVTVIDAATSAVLTTVALPNGSRPWGIAVSPDGTRVYVAGYNSSQIYVISAPGSVTPPDPPPPVFPPSAPREVTATAGDGSVVVSWQEPASSGSFPITHYQVTAEPGRASCLAKAPATTCEITQLTNGQPYVFTLAALNGAGWGSKSEPSKPVTPQRPCPRVTISLDQGTRSPEGLRDRMATVGSTTCLPEGARLTPHIRYVGQSSFSDGMATITVRADGSFVWSRLIRKGRGLTGYVSYLDTESNKVFWTAVR